MSRFIFDLIEGGDIDFFVLIKQGQEFLRRKGVVVSVVGEGDKV